MIDCNDSINIHNDKNIDSNIKNNRKKTHNQNNVNVFTIVNSNNNGNI